MLVPVGEESPVGFKVAPELLFTEANLEGFACFRVTRFKSVVDNAPGVIDLVDLENGDDRVIDHQLSFKTELSLLTRWKASNVVMTIESSRPI
jgi:hypothetical protein